MNSSGSHWGARSRRRSAPSFRTAGPVAAPGFVSVEESSRPAPRLQRSPYRKVESSSCSSLPYPYLPRSLTPPASFACSCCVTHDCGMHRKVQASPVFWRSLHLYVSAVVRAGNVSLHAMGPPRVVSIVFMAYLRRTWLSQWQPIAIRGDRGSQWHTAAISGNLLWAALFTGQLSSQGSSLLWAALFTGQLSSQHLARPQTAEVISRPEIV